MPDVTLSGDCPNDKPSVHAGVMLWALKVSKRLGLDAVPTTATEAIASAGSGRSQAYEVLARLEASVEDLFKAAGRPSTPPAEPDKALELCAAVRDFLMQHPGAASRIGQRHHFQDSFRSFVVGLFAPGALAHGLSVEKARNCLGVPLGTLKDWLATAPRAKADSEVNTRQPTVTVSVPDLMTIQFEYANWQGSMSSFCTYVRDELGMSYGRTFVTSVLVLSGQHRPRQRDGDPQAPWSRGTYKTLFPGVQWLGDGTLVTLDVNGMLFPFNVEAIVDTATNATVGIHVSATEDAEAVKAAYHEGLVSTEGQCPLSLMLDNKPCNHSAEVERGCPGATVLHSTPGRGQAKAAAEGSFGLFQQGCPELVIRGDTVVDVAQQIVRLIVTAWCIGRNGRPRRRLRGLSPAQLYQTFSASAEDLEEARKLVLALKDKEQRAAQTRKRRADATRLTILKEALAQLGINDPDNSIALQLAGYSLSAILQGIAIFKSRAADNTLPQDIEHHRYLGGIMRNLDRRSRLERMADELLKLRLKHSDLLRGSLMRQHESLIKKAPPDSLPAAMVELALRAQSQFDYRFWIMRTAEAVSHLAPATAMSQFRIMARLVASHHVTTIERREDIIRRLSEAVSLAQAAA